MDTELGGLSVLITGASGGIGWAIAEALAKEGALLALHAGRRLEELEERVARTAWRERAVCLRADVTDPNDVATMARVAGERLGRLDVCVANAGIWPGQALALQDLPLERIREVIDVNLLGALWTARAFLTELRRRGPRADGRGAALCLIGSTAGRFGEAGHTEYAVSKAGLYGLLRSLKNEIVTLDPGGRVNLVEPGWTVTPMAAETLADDTTLRRALTSTPLRQLARSADIARAVTFLCSPALARHVTGEVLTLAGGMEGRLLWEPDDIDPDRVRARLEE